VSDAEDLCFLPATILAERLRDGEVSAEEVMRAHLARIEAINPKVNAIVTLLPERAIEAARAADRAAAKGLLTGPLHGLPIAHKDLALTRGIRTTFGSPILRDFVPTEDQLIVERIGLAGAITIGKTNTPELGAGSQTFNEVFGETCNPWDPSVTCGGSSGGAAVALACGMVPIADGSDQGGSLRNPASFCNVVGFRPSPGRVPMWPAPVAWSPMSVEGPMGRTVADVALLLSVMAGPDARSPISLDEPGSSFRRPLERNFQGVRVAWSRDLGELPVDSRVTAAIEPGIDVLSHLGCEVVEASPDFSGADKAFKAWRAWLFELGFGRMLDTHREQLKDTVVWNIEEGRKLSGADLGRAEIERTRLYHRVREFMESYEFLVLPVSQVPPFDIGERWVREIEGVAMETYIDWMKSCYYITVTGLPAISMPCGFTDAGLPVGLQIVGRHHDDFGVLQLAHAFEQATELWKRRPPLVSGGEI
jgi:amidase